jgi:hypothetical protein
MAHFAKVVDGQVTQVIVAELDFFQDFVDNSPGEWIQTSYNTRGGKHYDQNGEYDGTSGLRKNYAGIGYTYDRERDAFIPPRPFATWVLNEDTCLWDPPVAYPSDGKLYVWNDATATWDET